jgi:hypothetical protein
MATATKSPARSRSTAKKAPAKAASAFNPQDLPVTGSKQFRQGGDYKPHVRALSAFAKGNPVAVAHVKALVHLGWVKPGGVNAASKSPAFTIADNGDLSTEQWNVGGDAAGQITANLSALKELGAPEENLNGLFAAYVGA